MCRWLVAQSGAARSLYLQKGVRMSSTMSSFAPQSVAWEPARGLVPVAGRPVLQSRFDAAHELPAWSSLHVTPSGAPAMVRQRFYPAQLRRMISPELESLAASRHHRLTWSGWDRSLPRCYLPVELLMRLIIDAVDSITRSVEQSSAARAKLTLRIVSPGGSNGTLVMALDADQWQCDPKFRGSLNAGWFRQGDQPYLWQRLARQCDAVGGWLSVADLPGGGSSLLISLPTDQPRALVHSWLSRLVQPGVSGSLERPTSVSLYVIGRSQSESLEQLRAANVRLQSLARPEDYIYRVSHGRWIWLTTQLDLPAFVKTFAWQSQQLDRWSCATTSSAIIDMAGQVERRFGQLLGSRVPPIDLRTHAVSRGPITSNRPNTRVDNAAPASHARHLHVQSRAKTTQSKWRYPI